MSYTHLSITERSQLEVLIRIGWSNREIGRELGRHHSAIARERKRGSLSGVYQAEQRRLPTKIGGSSASRKKVATRRS
ncbi:hypothetical protein MALU111345_14400 [Marinicrinis lubricantis]